MRTVTPTVAPAAAAARTATTRATLVRGLTTGDDTVAILSIPMAGYRELLRQVKAEIEEIDAETARELFEGPQPPLVVDVRRRDEWDEGHIPGAVHIPRGSLESRIEKATPGRERPVVVYCSVGERSAFAARTLGELGYEDVSSLNGGFTEWKRNGFPIQVDRGLDPRRRRPHLPRAADLRERRPDPGAGLGRDRRRRRQLPDALPRERRVGVARDSRRPRLDLPLRRTGDRVQAGLRSLLPLPLPAAAAARAGAVVRRGRRPRRPAGRDRLAAGERGAQARARDRRAARRPAPALRRARGDLRRDDRAAEPCVPGLRGRADDHRVRRLRRVLRGGARMSVVRLPTTLREDTRGEREVLADGETVRDLLDDLMARFPTLERKLEFANVYVEGEDVRTLDGLDTRVDDGSTVILLPAMAGG